MKRMAIVTFQQSPDKSMKDAGMELTLQPESAVYLNIIQHIYIFKGY